MVLIGSSEVYAIARPSRPILDVGASSPTVEVTLQTALDITMQCAVKDTASGHWYVTETSAPDVTISHCDASGTLLDSMTCTAAGHGTTIGIQTIDGDVWIWMAWAAGGTLATSQLVRFQYQSGTIAYADTEPMLAGYATPTVDEYADTITLRTTPDAIHEVFTVHRLSALESGIADDPIGVTVPLTASPPVAQGATYLDGTIYRLTGGASFRTDYIWQYRLTDSHLYSVVGVNQLDTAYSYYEFEGISVYRDSSGIPSLMFGIVTGPKGGRIRRVYRSVGV